MAIEIPERVKAALEAEVLPLRRELDLQWSPARNWHVTLAFLGEADPAAVKAALERVEGVGGPFDLMLAPWGTFPNPGAARVLWAGVSSGRELGDLAGQVRQAIRSVAPEMDTKAFKPHLTLGRTRKPTNLSGIDLVIPVATWTVSEFVLVESRVNARPTFLDLARYPVFR